MYLWVFLTPYRNGDLDADILINKLTHGLSRRLTGGLMDLGCLGYGGHGGMSEDWSGFMTTIILSTGAYEDYPIGAWAFTDANSLGVYLCSMNSRPIDIREHERTRLLQFPRDRHHLGRDSLGRFALSNLEARYWSTLFLPQSLPNGAVPIGNFYLPRGKNERCIPKQGNSLMTQLLILGMKFQPCRPLLFNARNAIIEADRILTGGQNACELWAGFSVRGLGVGALIRDGSPWGGGYRTNDFLVLNHCR
ncbi:unnamed protein product [Rhizoctonia solani]|uniref:Extracellular metalloproteinase n=1 Tax=Rhizoctonia solani TaxID=456999 RepID=A0A8H2XUD5_9AGAM|nr:unnamed protein product [Rhizoctonia solani]